MNSIERGSSSEYLDISGSGEKHIPFEVSQVDTKGILDAAIDLSSDATHEELVAALDQLLNSAGVQPEWISELNVDGRNKMNGVVNKYCQAKKNKADLGELLKIKTEFEGLFVQ